MADKDGRHERLSSTMATSVPMARCVCGGGGGGRPLLPW